MRTVILLACLIWPCLAQLVEVTAQPLTSKEQVNYVQQMLGKEATKLITVWAVALENKSAESVMIQPGAVRAKMIQTVPYLPEVLQPIIARAESTTTWNRVGRVGLVAGAIVATVTTSGLVSAPPQVAAGAAEGVKILPWIVAQFRGEQIQIGQNFGILSWREGVSLGPAQAATVFLFTSKQGDGVQVQRFVLDLGGVARVKVAQ